MGGGVARKRTGHGTDAGRRRMERPGGIVFVEVPDEDPVEGAFSDLIDEDGEKPDAGIWDVVDVVYVEDKGHDGKKAAGKPAARGKPKTVPAAGKKAPAPNKAGFLVYLLGAAGIVSCVFLDPVLHLFDSSHPARIDLGSLQLAGVLVSTIAMLGGLVLTFKEYSKGFF